MEEKIVYEITTALAEMKVYEDRCVLSNKKNAFTLLLTNKSRSGNSSGAYSSENAISFAKGDLEKMEQIYNYIDGRIREIKTQGTQGTSATSSADELKKFKELLDSGIITQEEFDAKKKQLLGL